MCHLLEPSPGPCQPQVVSPNQVLYLCPNQVCTYLPFVSVNSQTLHTTEEGACTICLDTGPPPIQKGCACRGDAGLAHVDCLVHAAVSQQAQRDMSVWWRCQTCNHDFTGAMLIGLANAWVAKAAIGDGTANLPAKTHLAKSLCSVGK
jgi:hypothetical protein